jgi:hypothetical protein
MHNAIALIPGFLGFDHQGELTYFADRFLAGLRATVEGSVREPAFVVPVPVPPIGSLAERQDALLQGLRNLDQSAKGGPFAWHLVGHSTGGLDAAMLLRETALDWDQARGSYFSHKPLHAPNLRSVTSIAAPHYGTCITRAPLLTVTKGRDVTIDDGLQAILELPEFALDLFQRDALATRLKFSRGAAGNSSIDFFHHLIFADKLLRDLDPNVASALTQTPNVRLKDVPVLSIATLAPAPTHENTKDHLFSLLWKWTQLKAQGSSPTPPAIGTPATVIASDRSALPATAGDIGWSANDGVVNTNRQVYGAFAGLVLADHCDVLGRYRRADAIDHSVLDPGLLTSGANFQDDQFFALLRLIANGIASQWR